MGKKQEAIDALADFSSKFGPHQTAIYQVVTVDEVAQTCEAIDDDGIEYLVRLTPIVTPGQSILCYPQEGKKILAARLEDSGDWFVSWAEQNYKIVYRIGNCVLESDGQKWTIRNNAANMLDVFNNIIEAVQVVAVVYGSNPDFSKLASAKTLIQNLLQ